MCCYCVELLSTRFDREQRNKLQIKSLKLLLINIKSIEKIPNLGVGTKQKRLID